MVVINNDWVLSHSNVSLDDAFNTRTMYKSWCALWVDLFPTCVETFESVVDAMGLFPTIDLCSRWADRLLANPDDFWRRASQDSDVSFVGMLSYELKQCFNTERRTVFASLFDQPDQPNPSMEAVLEIDNSATIALSKALLQVLRYPKRFTLSDADEFDTIDAFVKNDKRIKEFDRVGIPDFIREGLQMVARSYFPKYNHVEYTPDRYWAYVPTGTTAEGCHNSFEKYLVASAQHLVPEHARLRASLADPDDDVYSRYTTVPKGYKERRGICEELLKTTLNQSPFADYLEKATHSRKGKFAPDGHVTIHDQRTNRRLCYDASFSGELSTIDMHAASDSISAAVASAILPVAAGNDFFVLRSNKVLIPGKYSRKGRLWHPRTLHLACTMGSRMTFPLECHVFWCFVCLAVEIQVGLGCGSYSDLKYCAVYGDDIVIPTKYVDTLLWLLERCGFIVNEKKSYTTTSGFIFRESCGVEFINGTDVSSVLWPRRVIKMDDVTALIALHNHLYDAGFTHAASSIKDSLLEAGHSDIPTVSPDSNEVGLHGIRRVVASQAKPPCGIFADIYKVSLRVLHTDFGDVQYTDNQVFIRKLVNMPLPDLSIPLYLIDESRAVPVYDNRKLVNSSLFDGPTQAIIKDLFEEFCMWRSVGCEQMSYDDVCRQAKVVQPRNFRKALDVTDKIRFVHHGVLVSE